jgi:hypothetical protein
MLPNIQLFAVSLRDYSSRLGAIAPSTSAQSPRFSIFAFSSRVESSFEFDVFRSSQASPSVIS